MAFRNQCFLCLITGIKVFTIGLLEFIIGPFNCKFIHKNPFSQKAVLGFPSTAVVSIMIAVGYANTSSKGSPSEKKFSV